jgi:hypothetical protein
MTDSTPLPPASAKREVQEIEDPTIGLSIQFIVAMMLVRGDVEVTIPKSCLDQAMDKLITATTNPDGGFTVRIFRE